MKILGQYVNSGHNYFLPYLLQFICVLFNVVFPCNVCKQTVACSGLVLLLPTPVKRTTICAPKYSAECTLALTVIDGSLENKALLLPLSFTATFTLVLSKKKKESQKYLNLSTVICIRWWLLLPKQPRMQHRRICHWSASCSFSSYKETVNDTKIGSEKEWTLILPYPPF
jgi:hypothetical protein